MWGLNGSCEVSFSNSKMCIPYSLRVSYRNISNNSNQVYDTMVHATKCSVKDVTNKNTVVLLRQLKENNVGTNEVEHGVTRLCKNMSNKSKNEIKSKIMRNKVNDAYKLYREHSKENDRIWREAKRVITVPYRKKYLEEWKRHITNVKEKLQRKTRAKVEWLKEKWGAKRQQKEIPDEVKGIMVKDEDLPDEFSSEPRVYGNVELKDNEIEALKMSPNFGLYKEVNITKLNIETEEAINKYRWNKIIEEDKVKDNVSNSFINEEKKEVNINNLRATDLPFNYIVTMPKPIDRNDEIKLHKFKNDIMRIGEEVGEKYKKWSNVSEEEKEGIESIIERERKKELVCYKTDKSGRWSCDTPNNYKEGCLKLLKDESKTPKITEEEHRIAEKDMNCQAIALTRMMGLNNSQTGDRLTWALTAEGTRIAPLYGMRKDHKEVEEKDRDVGPDMRPVCGAEDCSTKRVSYILSRILSKIVPGRETQCDSTEEMVKVFKAVNEGEVQPDWIVGSLDVKSLYPSLNIERCARVVRERLNESDFQFVGQDWREISLYLRYHMSTEEVEEEGIMDFCPKRKHKGKPPEFTSSGSSLKKESRHGPWRFPTKSPDAKKTRYMLCIAIEIMIVKVMKSHDYEFAGDIYRQSGGGAIGLDLTGVLADIYMGHWDEVLLNRLRDEYMRVVIYQRYKEDINYMIYKTTMGWIEQG